jgi:hypothetical protein
MTPCRPHEGELQAAFVVPLVALCRAAAVRRWVMTLEPGPKAAFQYTVTQADTAVALGRGGAVPCWPPRGCSPLAERATVAAVAGALEVGATTVGIRSSWPT